MFDKIKLIVSDFDGVMTNNKFILNQSGKESVILSRADGLGISEIRKKGYLFLVISSEKNTVVAKRCEKLGIPFYHGVADKYSILKDYAEKNSITVSEVCFVGNDINDLPCLEKVGLPIVVKDAHYSVKEVAKLVLETNGGDGVFREVFDFICKA